MKTKYVCMKLKAIHQEAHCQRVTRYVVQLEKYFLKDHIAEAEHRRIFFSKTSTRDKIKVVHRLKLCWIGSGSESC
jgi:hypothetical protein